MTIDPPNDLPKKERKLTLIFCLSALILGVVVLLGWFFIFRTHIYTDDSYVEGNQIVITPLRPGFIKAIHTDDTFLAEEGQLLIELDETDSLIALNEAQDRLGNVVREVCQTFHQLSAYQAEIEVRKAEFIKSAQDLEHRLGVIEAGGVSIEDLEHAQAAYRAAYYSLKMSESLYDTTLALIRGTSIRNHPKVLFARNQLKEAWVQLYRCKIYAPCRGLTAQRTAQVGMWVKQGEPLMSVIPLDQIWVNANFKETQLKHVRIGQRARITADLYGREQVYHGKIVGLPGGAGNVFSLLPPQNLSGNWIKIVQRLPVRVALDPSELQQHPLRIGLSMRTWVDTGNQSGLLVPQSSEGSPLYDTSIFDLEEVGSEVMIEKIILDNLDPLLNSYLDTPYYPETGAADDESSQPE